MCSLFRPATILSSRQTFSSTIFHCGSEISWDWMPRYMRMYVTLNHVLWERLLLITPITAASWHRLRGPISFFHTATTMKKPLGCVCLLSLRILVLPCPLSNCQDQIYQMYVWVASIYLLLYVHLQHFSFRDPHNWTIIKLWCIFLFCLNQGFHVRY